MSPVDLGYHMPAEWEPHAATWLTWPCSKDWPGKLQAVRWIYCEIIRLLVRYERVNLVVTQVVLLPLISCIDVKT